MGRNINGRLLRTCRSGSIVDERLGRRRHIVGDVTNLCSTVKFKPAEKTRVIVSGKVALMAVLGAVALGFVMALATSPTADSTGSNVLFVISNNIVVTVDPAEKAE
jgi:hypothetical protein